MIQFGAITQATGEGWEGIPDSPNPFYFAAGDGLFVHKRTLLGRGIARMVNMPPYPKIGFDKGGFYFEANPVPAQIMGQVVDFFDRIYTRQHTEAAVLLVMHEETKEWRVFVPTQLVSHGGVNYVFDPMHIRRPWIIVGSIHSHCDFGAGHSSTDTTDASDGFDGLHMTIGHIKRPDPEIVAMVSTNKALIHYPKDMFPALFDWSEVRQHKAPAWWDRYVEDTINKEKPVGFDLYKKFDKPTLVKSETKITKVSGAKPSPGYQSKGYNADDWYYHDGMKRMVHRKWTISKDGDTYTISYGNGSKVEAIPGVGIARTQTTPRTSTGSRAPLGYREVRPGIFMPIHGGEYGSTSILRESAEFNARRAAERGLRWTPDGELDLSGSGLKITDLTDEEKELLKELHEADESIGGMNQLPNDLLDNLFESNLLTDADLEWACLNEEASGRVGEWREILIRKLFNNVLLLREMGQEVDVSFGNKPPSDLQMELLPSGGQGSEDMIGVH